MQHSIFRALFLLACSIVGGAVTAADFYVAANGNDSNSGQLDSPVVSLKRAVELARAVTNEPKTIWLRSGTHYLSETLVLKPADSGSPNAPLVIRNFQNEQPSVSGGQKLSLNWKPYRDGILKASVPAGLEIDQLFVNSSRQNMARHPNFDPNARYFNGFAADAISPERVKGWANPKGAFFHVMHHAHWGDFHYLIQSKSDDGKLKMEGGWQNNRPSPMHQEHRFVENVFEELDTPGEWFHDENSSTLHYFPATGVEMTNALVEVVRLRHLVELRGSESDPIHDIQIDGIRFRHTARTFMDNREPLLRSDWTTYRGGAIVIEGGEDISLTNLLLDEVGGNGIFVNMYNRRVEIKGCRIENAGASSIAFIGDPSAVRSPLFQYGQKADYQDVDTRRGPKGSNFPAECLVENCLLVRNGRFEKQTAGVNISMSMKISLRHNSIYDVPRAGINICDGTWGGHLIEHNDVFDTVRETGDHGSFNSWGRDRFWKPDINQVNEWVAEHPDWPLLDAMHTTVIRNNRFRCDYGWDIDLDDGSTNYEIYDNLCLSGGIKNREGFHRTVRNNIIVNNTFHPHVWFKNSRDVCTNNIIWKDYLPAGMKHWGEELDYNLVQRADKDGAVESLHTLTGQDEHTIFGDAMFVDPPSGDYRVKADSDAMKVGFRNFPMDRFGVTSEELMKIAKKPILPESALGRSLVNYGWGQDKSRRDTVVSWHGAKIKNLSGAAELSSTGSAEATGIYLKSVPQDCVAFQNGMRERDVVLKCNGTKVHEVSDLLLLQRDNRKGELKLEVWRNQQTVILDF
jgi:hypothetical protein